MKISKLSFNGIPFTSATIFGGGICFNFGELSRSHYQIEYVIPWPSLGSLILTDDPTDSNLTERIMESLNHQSSIGRIKLRGTTITAVNKMSRLIYRSGDHSFDVC